MSKPPIRCAIDDAARLSCVGLALVLLSGSSSASTFLTKTVVCPLDGTKISYEAQGSSYQSGQRLDLKPLGAIAAPSPVPVCPNDHLVVVDEHPSDEKRAKLAALVASDGYRSAAQRHDPHFLIAMMHQSLGERPDVVALAYLRSSWAATGVERIEALEASHAAYLLALEDQRPNEAQRWTIRAVLGEIERLLSRFDSAQARFEGLARTARAREAPFDRIVPYELELIAAKDAQPHAIPEVPDPDREAQIRRRRAQRPICRFVDLDGMDQCIAGMSERECVDTARGAWEPRGPCN